MSNWFQKKIEEYQANRRRRKYGEEKFFRLYTKEGVIPSDLAAIEILEGKYKGTIFSFTSMFMEDDNGLCSFDIRIIEGTYSEDYLKFDKEFGRICGQILLVVLENSIKHTQETSNYDELGENYSEEPVQRRTVYQKDSPLSED